MECFGALLAALHPDAILAKLSELAAHVMAATAVMILCERVGRCSIAYVRCAIVNHVDGGALCWQVFAILFGIAG